MLHRGLYKNIDVAVSVHLEPFIIAPENPDIKLLFESYPGIMCCSAERLAL